MKPSIEAIQSALMEIIEEMTEDWDLDLDGHLGPDTALIEELCFSSIEALNLMAAIGVRFDREFPYEQLVIRDGQYVTDLTIGEIAGYLHDVYDAAPVTTEPRPM